MVTGRKALHLIDAQITAQRRRVDNSTQSTADFSRQIIDARRDETSALENMSRLRLELLASGSAHQGLGYIDRQVAALLNDHESELSQQQTHIDSMQLQIQALETERRAQEKAVETAIAAYDKAAAQSQKGLLKDPEYVTILTDVETLEAQIERADAKLSLAREDELEKGTPYREDIYFTYLQKRRFGTKSAKGWLLTKALDRWVANLTDYQTAAVNYQRLQAIPQRLQAHLDGLNNKGDVLRSELAQRERHALIADGVEDKRQASLLMQSRIEKIDAKIAQCEIDLQALRQDQGAAISGRAGPYLEALTLMTQTLSKTKLPNLRALAAQTRSVEDDDAVQRILQLRNHISDLASERKESESVFKRLQSGLGDLEALRRQFKQSRFDAPYSEFPSGGSVLQRLLEQLLIGSMSGRETWRRVQRLQRTVQRRTDVDFGGIDWGQAMRLPRNYPQSRRRSGNIFGGSPSPGRRSAPRISRPPRSRPRSGNRGGRGGGFRTGGGF